MPGRDQPEKLFLPWVRAPERRLLQLLMLVQRLMLLLLLLQLLMLLQRLMLLLLLVQLLMLLQRLLLLTLSLLHCSHRREGLSTAGKRTVVAAAGLLLCQFNRGL